MTHRRPIASGAELDDWLAFARDLCDAADAISLPAFRSELQIDRKIDGTFVTQADRAVERSIRERVMERYPGHGIIGEEYGTDGDGASHRWFVDPIDGTHNFMRGMPIFATLVAVDLDGELQAGMVSAPALGRRWWARRGGGAWVSEYGAAPRRIGVSTVDQLDQAQLLYRSLLDMRGSGFGDGFERLLTTVWRDKGMGDFWGHMLVAEGAAEMMMEADLGPWDLGAPWIIVEEAGGRITDFQGRRDVFGRQGLSTNGLLHEPVLALLHSHDAPGQGMRDLTRRRTTEV